MAVNLLSNIDDKIAAVRALSTMSVFSPAKGILILTVEDVEQMLFSFGLPALVRSARHFQIEGVTIYKSPAHPDYYFVWTKCPICSSHMLPYVYVDCTVECANCGDKIPGELTYD